MTVNEKDLHHGPYDAISVLHGRLIYISIADRAAFDKIAAPCIDRGQKDYGHVLTKTIEQSRAGDTVEVTFRYHINRLSDAALLRRHLERETKSGGDS